MIPYSSYNILSPISNTEYFSSLLCDITDDATSEIEQFSEIISEVVEHSPSLNKLDLFIRKSSIKGLENMVREKISMKQKNCNWDICYKIVIK